MMRTIHSRRHVPLMASLLTLGLLSTLGCGQSKQNYEMIDVTGAITFDGSPLANAAVAFYSDTRPPAYGMTDSSGQFKLETREHGQGVPKGEYIVRIGSTDQTTNGSGKNVTVPSMYEENGVAIVAISDQGEKTFDFNLKSRPGKNDYVSTNTLAEP